MHHNFHEYAPQRGEVPGRGERRDDREHQTRHRANAFALNNLQQRGVMFVEPTQEACYEGQIVAENSRDNDMVVNPNTAEEADEHAHDQQRRKHHP